MTEHGMSAVWAAAIAAVLIAVAICTTCLECQKLDVQAVVIEAEANK